jgi:hypothetical protein
MVDLVGFLRARLDEEERIARAAEQQIGGGQWKAEPDAAGNLEVVGEPYEGSGGIRVVPVILTLDDDETMVFIAEHDPARVLREVEAKRELLDRYEELVASGKEQGHVLGGDVGEEYLYCVLPALALSYSGHPDFDESWRP